MAAKKKTNNAQVGRASKRSSAKSGVEALPEKFEFDMPLDAQGEIYLDGVFEPTFATVMKGVVDLRDVNTMMAPPLPAPPAAAPAAASPTPEAPSLAPSEPVVMSNMNVELGPPPSDAPRISSTLMEKVLESKVPLAHVKEPWTGPLPNVVIEGLDHGVPGVGHVTISLPKGASRLEIKAITLHPTIRNSLLLRQVFHRNNVPYYEEAHDMGLEGWNPSEANIWIPQNLVVSENQPVVLLHDNPRNDRVMIVGAIMGKDERYLPIES